MKNQKSRTRSHRGRVLALALVSALCVSLCMTAPALGASPGDTGRRLQEAAAAVDSARTFLARKDDAGAKKRLGEAEDIYSQILRLERDQREATLGLSGVFFLQKRYDDGVKMLSPIHDRAPDDLDITHQLGLHLYRSGQQKPGLALLESAAEDPKRFDAIWLLVQHHYNNGDFCVGLPYAQRYAEVRPDDTDALALVGTYYLKNSLLPQAIAAFDRYLEDHPDNASVVLNRANALFRNEQYDKAGTVYATLLATQPENNRYTYNLAAVRVRQGRCSDAIPLLQALLTREPTFGPALYFRADCLRRTGNLEDAERAYREAAAGGQSNPWIFYGLSQIEHRRGNAPEALVNADKALKLGPNEAELNAWQGTLLRREGRFEPALVLHDRAVELEPTAGPYQTERGFDLFRLERFADSATAFDRALALNPNDPTATRGAVAALLELVRSHLKKNATSEAQAAAAQAVKLAPASGRARAYLALVTLRQGDAATAAAALKAAPTPTTELPDLAAASAMVALVAGDEGKAKASYQVAVEGKSDLVAALPELRAYIAAADDDWATAAQALEEAADRGDGAPGLEAARAVAWLEFGLERLGRGDGAGTREGLGKAKSLQRFLGADDQVTLEFAQQALGVVSSGSPEQAAKNLAQTLQSARYSAATHARIRDLGQGYVAYGLLAAGKGDEAMKALDRVREHGILGGAWEILRAAAEVAEARRLFQAGRPADAERLWATVVGDTAAAHNAAVARFAAGRQDEAERDFRALAEAKNPPVALYNLAVALGRRGDHLGARDAFRRYLTTPNPSKREEAERRASAIERLFGLKAGGTP